MHYALDDVGAFYADPAPCVCIFFPLALIMFPEDVSTYYKHGIVPWKPQHGLSFFFSARGTRGNVISEFV